MYIKDLSAIGGIEWPWGNRVIRRGIHVVPPKEFRAREAGSCFAQLFPDFAAMHQMIGLLPELHLRQFAIVPAVGDDPVFARQQAGQIR